MVFHSPDADIEFFLCLRHQIRTHLILGFHESCGNGSMQLRICGPPNPGDKADKNWCEGRAMQCYFEIWQSLADANLDLTPPRLLVMEVGNFVTGDDGKRCVLLQDNVHCWCCE